MAKSVTYKREFFDREYSAKEAYGRLWGFTRKYRFRIYLGILCGMLTAGTLLPLFQVIQPALDKVGSVEQGAAAKMEAPHTGGSRACATVESAMPAAAASKAEKKVLKEYGKLKKVAEMIGFELQDENEALGAMARCAFLFLNKYCLSWAALHTVKDVRCSILRHIQKQSMQFHGRIDVGQLMSGLLARFYDPREGRVTMDGVDLRDLRIADLRSLVGSVMQEGKIVERGTHAELYAANGVYRKLCDMQNTE